jgi:hypothetical protein
LNSTQIHPSTLASLYYPNFLPAWRPTSLQPQANNPRAEANLTYINTRPPHITYIKTSCPQQPTNGFEPLPPPPHPPLPPPPHQVQLPPPKNEPNLENQINPHTPLPTISMILPIAGGSTMEFQTKKQKKDHLRLVNNIAMQGPVRCTDWSKTPITFIEQDLQLESYPHADAMVIQANRSTPWEKYHSQCPLAINKTQEQSISPST